MKPGSVSMPFFGVDPVILRQDETEADENEGGHLCLRKPWPGMMRTEIGPIASPDKLHFADALPKARSGKIMRRILWKIAEGAVDQLGDTSTLAKPDVVDKLVKGRQ